MKKSNKEQIMFDHIKETTNVSVSKIYRAINELKQKGYIKRLEGRKLGHWEIIKYP